MTIETQKSNTEEIRGYCATCASFCPTIAYVRDGVFLDVKADEEHPNFTNLCPKGLAAPELVYSKQRLRYPLRRTRPKDDPNPGWKRITWDEALNTIATRLSQIKARWGAESVAVARGGIGSSSLWEAYPWFQRLRFAFGTPNLVGPGYICQWHRDSCSAYTYGTPGMNGTRGVPDLEQASGILIWGANPHATDSATLRDIRHGTKQGAKLVVIDPRKTELAAMADLWLQLKPATDGALALGMLHVLLEEGLYDYDFARDWTTAPLVVRSNTGSLLKASDIEADGDSSSYVVADVGGNIRVYTPGVQLMVESALDTNCTVKLTSGKKIKCRTVFGLLRDLASEYPPSRVEVLTGVPANLVKKATRMLADSRRICLWTYNGIEQSTNASQTNRALNILYALIGDYDKPGGNVLPNKPPLNPVMGQEFLTPEASKKCLGYHEHPLGPAGLGAETQPHQLYRAILTGKPYPIRALLGFGGNLVTDNPASLMAKEALARLDFHAHADLFLTPTAELADIVLPVTSSWETDYMKTDFLSLRAMSHFQWRPAVVSPQYEAWPDIKIVFELAKRLGLGDKFWDGDIEAAFNYQLAPSGLTVEKLRTNPGGITLSSTTEYQKYQKQDESGRFLGFPTPSKRVEIYSQVFKDHGYNPLPVWEEPISSRFTRTDSAAQYPLTLINAKTAYYCHGQHRALPSLRKVVPYPCVEINPVKAKEIPCQDGDWVILETPYGKIRVQAKLSEGMPSDIVCAQHGWWQGCPELNLPAYNPYSPQGANVNLLYPADEEDPISGALPIKGFPCNIRKE